MADKARIEEFRSKGYRLLDDEFLVKDEAARSKLEDFIVQTGRAFLDALHRHVRDTIGQAEEERSTTRPVSEILRAYNEVNERRVDVAAIEHFKQPVLKD